MNYEKDTNCPTTSNLEEGLAFPSLTPERRAPTDLRTSKIYMSGVESVDGWWSRRDSLGNSLAHCFYEQHLEEQKLARKREVEQSPFLRSEMDEQGSDFDLNESAFYMHGANRARNSLQIYFPEDTDNIIVKIEEVMKNLKTTPQRFRAKPKLSNSKASIGQSSKNSFAINIEKSKSGSLKKQILLSQIKLQHLKEQWQSSTDHQHSNNHASRKFLMQPKVRLKELCLEVYRVVTNSRHGMSYRDVVDKLVCEDVNNYITQDDQDKYKNIKRRIYDCLNVMISSGCLHRTDRAIKLIDPTTTTLIHARLAKQQQKEKLQIKIQDHTERLQEKILQMKQLEAKLQACRRLRLRNKNMEIPEERIKVPFLIVEGKNLHDYLGKMIKTPHFIQLPLPDSHSIFCQIDSIQLLNQHGFFSESSRKAPTKKQKRIDRVG